MTMARTGDKIEYVDMGAHRQNAVVWSRGPKPSSLWVIPEQGPRRYVLVGKRRELYQELVP